MIQEIANIGNAVIETGSTGLLMGLLVVLAVPQLRKKVFNGNGNFKKEITEIKENHLHGVDAKLDKIISLLEKQHDVCQRNNFIIESLKEKK